MSKRILFVGISLKVGGIERALVDQMNDLVQRDYSVDLYLFSHTGAYLKDIDSRIGMLPEGRLVKYAGLTYSESKRSVISFILRNLFAVIAKWKGSNWLFTKLFSFENPVGNYDIAISYFNDNGTKSLYYGCNLFLLEKVKATKKLGWIHSDYILTGLNTPEINKQYCLMDGVVNVSKTMKNKFDTLGIVPPNKSYFVYNILQKERILNNSTFNVDLPLNHGLRIVTVGRLEDNKGTMELLDIAYNMKENGLLFMWYFIGNGVQYKDALNFVDSKGLGGYVYILGQKDNPYSYIKACDLYVSGSKSETFGISILESLVLYVPVVAFRYDAIDEILTEENGIVCNTYVEMQNEIENLIMSEDALAQLKKKVALLFDYKDKNRVQFDNIIERILE